MVGSSELKQKSKKRKKKRKKEKKAEPEVHAIAQAGSGSEHGHKPAASSAALSHDVEGTAPTAQQHQRTKDSAHHHGDKGNETAQQRTPSAAKKAEKAEKAEKAAEEAMLPLGNRQRPRRKASRRFVQSLAFASTDTETDIVESSTDWAETHEAAEEVTSHLSRGGSALDYKDIISRNFHLKPRILRTSTPQTASRTRGRSEPARVHNSRASANVSASTQWSSAEAAHPSCQGDNTPQADADAHTSAAHGTRTAAPKIPSVFAKFVPAPEQSESQHAMDNLALQHASQQPSSHHAVRTGRRGGGPMLMRSLLAAGIVPRVPKQPQSNNNSNRGKQQQQQQLQTSVGSQSAEGVGVTSGSSDAAHFDSLYGDVDGEAAVDIDDDVISDDDDDDDNDDDDDDDGGGRMAWYTHLVQLAQSSLRVQESDAADVPQQPPPRVEDGGTSTAGEPVLQRPRGRYLGSAPGPDALPQFYRESLLPGALHPKEAALWHLLQRAVRSSRRCGIV